MRRHITPLLLLYLRRTLSEEAKIAAPCAYACQSPAAQTATHAAAAAAARLVAVEISVQKAEHSSSAMQRV
jgi:hypothetical protein